MGSERVKMVKFGLQFKATLENVTNVRPLGEDFRWFLKLKCGSCGEISEKWQYITLVESTPLKGGRGSASMVQKCKLCSRENSIGNKMKSVQSSVAFFFPNNITNILQISLQTQSNHIMQR